MARLISLLMMAGSVLIAPAARADLVRFKDGSELEGEVVIQGQLIKIRTPVGTIVRPRSQVKEIIKKKTQGVPARGTAERTAPRTRTRSGTTRKPSGARPGGLRRKPTGMLARFRAERKPIQFMTLMARAGYVVTLERSERMVNEWMARARARGQSSEEAADVLLDRMKLTPKYTRETVEAAKRAFKEKHGRKAVVLESRRFWVLSDDEPPFVRKIALHMDAMFDEYQRRIQFKEKITDKFLLILYRSRMEYQMSGAPVGSAAYYSARKRSLVGYHNRTDERRTYASLQHEGCHQFLHFYVPSPPTWFDEGLAEYFEPSKLLARPAENGQRFRVGVISTTSLRVLKNYERSGSLVPLKHFMQMRQQEYYLNARICYPQGWGLTYFLLENRRTPEYKKFWMNYFFALRDGLTPKEATAKVFARVNWERFDKVFHDFIRRNAK